MASYGVGANVIGMSCVYDPFGTTSTTQAGCISYRQAQISEQNQTNHVYLYHNLNSDLGTPSVESFNSRSPANNGNYLSGVSSPSQPIIVCAMAPYNNSTWTSMPRRAPVCNSDDQLVLAVFIQGDLAQTGRPCMTIDEDAFSRGWSRGRMRRPTRPGFWNMFGNSINKMTITGGGAFSTIYAVFQADLMWVDTSAWRNGSNRQSSWNINVLGDTVNQRTLVGMGT